MTTGISGTWYKNTYPGCACDVPSHMYSLSFEKNPNWSQAYSPQPEIRAYFEKVAKKHDVYRHVHLQHKGLSARWLEDEQLWEVEIEDIKAGKVFKKRANILVSAIGGLDKPAYPNIPGLKEFPGDVWHSAEWNHKVSLEGKRVAVLGNGCSAIQFVPIITKQVGHLYQFVRTPHWMLPKGNSNTSGFFRFLLTWIPGFKFLYRALLFMFLDQRYIVIKLRQGTWIRTIAQWLSKRYISKVAPEKYKEFLIPKFPLGCKRIVLDDGYVKNMYEKNYDLIWDPITSVEGKEVVTKSGARREVDIIIAATGFQAQDALKGIKIHGLGNEELNDRWARQKGMQAYNGTTIAGFPNFFVLLGPNTATGHNSIIFAVECQANFMVKLLKPLANGRISAVVVKEEAEEKFNKQLHKKLSSTVWASHCTSFYKNEHGKITATWPGTMTSFWWSTIRPKWKDFDVQFKHVKAA